MSQTHYFEVFKDPGAVLDYAFDWTEWLASGETILTSTWDVDAGLTKDTDTQTAKTATVWLSGGTVGRHYTVVNHITTSGGRTEERTLKVHMVER